MEETNPFARFIADKKQAEIKSLGVMVTLRQPTIAEANSYAASIYSDTKADGSLALDYSKVSTANLSKIASCLLEPKMTLEDFQGLGKSADKAIAEILKEIDDWDGSERKMEAQAKQLSIQNGTKYEDELNKLLGESGN